MIEVNRKRWGYFYTIYYASTIEDILARNNGNVPKPYIAWREKLPFVLMKIAEINEHRLERGLVLYNYLIMYMDYNSNYISHYTEQEARRLLKVNKL